MDQTTPPQVEQTERMSTDSNTTVPVVAHLTDERGKGVVLADGLPEFYMLAYSTAPLVKLSDAQAVTAALQREVEELRELLIDARDTLCDLDTAYAYSLRNRIDAAMASKAEVPNV